LDTYHSVLRLKAVCTIKPVLDLELTKIAQLFWEDKSDTIKSNLTSSDEQTKLHAVNFN